MTEVTDRRKRSGMDCPMERVGRSWLLALLEEGVLV